ncbi:MAG TPA: AsmA family protein, partial [bacterium]|nr:AsmA family protein [bacterium]
MKKLIKFALITGAAFILLLGIAAVVVAIKFPPEKIKAIAIEKLSDTLKRKVTLGDAHFNVLTGISLTDLKISNRPGWAAGNMVAAKEISISYHLFPLLWGQISLGEIKLMEPQILLERRGLSQFNFSDMVGDASATAPAAAPAPAAPAKAKAKPKAKAAPKKKARKRASSGLPEERQAFTSFFADAAWADTAAAKPSKSALLLSVDSINIVHGKLTYLDETTNPVQKSDLKDLNLRVKNISMVGGKTTFSLETPLNYTNVSYQLSLDGSLRYFLAIQALKELDVKGKVNGVGFRISGSAANLTTDFAPDMDGEMSLNALEVLGLLPKSLAKMPEGLSLTGPAKVDFHLSGTVRSGLQLKGSADASDLAVKYKDLFAKTNKDNCKVDFRSVIGQDGSFDLPEYKLVYENWEVSGAFHHPNNRPWSC